MEYRTLGRTGLKVSRLGFGGAPIGLQGYLTADDRDSRAFQAGAVEALREAVRLGVSYFDTAPGYGEGLSERLMGEALESARDQVVLATKYGFDRARPAERYTELLEASLERLRTGRVDVLQFHGGYFHDETADAVLASGVLDWARDMQARGLCRFTGITAEGPSGALERLLRTGKVDVLEIAYNAIYQSCCDYQREPTGIVPLAKSLGLGVTTMRTTTCQVLPRLVALELPDADPARLVRLAIRFVLSTPEIDCALVGMRTAEEVRRNVALAEDPSARIDLKALHKRYV
ncbi:MAG TPA: aldo/keto reductase [Phycisphaerae bacterium]|nr:aldo/keto reductase [Phycisphaerae bacterium]